MTISDAQEPMRSETAAARTAGTGEAAPSTTASPEESPKFDAMRAALERFDEADQSLMYWLHERNVAGRVVLDLLRVHPRHTTLSFSTQTMPWTWRAKRGAHLTPSARRELRRLQSIKEIYG